MGAPEMVPSVGVFQFTPLREGRLSVMSPEPYTVIFQFTPLREGRRDQRRLAVPEKHFNSRPSARGDTKKQQNSHFDILFQFTPLREGRPPSFLYSTSHTKFQFTPLREGRRETIPNQETEE